MCECVHVRAIPTEARKGQKILPVGVICGCETSSSSWKHNSSHMQERQVVLIPETSFWPISCGCFKCCKIPRENAKET